MKKNNGYCSLYSANFRSVFGYYYDRNLCLTHRILKYNQERSLFHGTVVNSYDLTTCPSWVQVPNRPCRHTVGLTILLWGVIQKSLKANPTSDTDRSWPTTVVKRRRRRRRQSKERPSVTKETKCSLTLHNVHYYLVILINWLLNNQYIKNPFCANNFSMARKNMFAH